MNEVPEQAFRVLLRIHIQDCGMIGTKKLQGKCWGRQRKEITTGSTPRNSQVATPVVIQVATSEVNLHHTQKANLWHLLNCLEGQLCDVTSDFETLKCGGNTWRCQHQNGNNHSQQIFSQGEVFQLFTPVCTEHQPFANLGCKWLLFTARLLWEV